MAEQEKASKNGDSNQAAASKSGKLDLAKKSENTDGGDNGHGESGLSLASNEAKGEIQVGSFAVAGLRPIAPSHLEVFATILNGRPITASHLQVMEYAGNRPIFASNIEVRDDLTLPGGRPILISDPKLMQASTLPGGRPIASNQIDDGETLMGFID